MTLERDGAPVAGTAGSGGSRRISEPHPHKGQLRISILSPSERWCGLLWETREERRDVGGVLDVEHAFRDAGPTFGGNDQIREGLVFGRSGSARSAAAPLRSQPCQVALTTGLMS